jgi:hypothetical protein
MVVVRCEEMVDVFLSVPLGTKQDTNRDAKLRTNVRRHFSQKVLRKLGEISSLSRVEFPPPPRASERQGANDH